MRARRRGGGWTRWTALHDAGDHGPDTGSGAAGTDPAWTGAADEFQLRLRGPRARPARPLRALGARGPCRAPPLAARAPVAARAPARRAAADHALRVGRRQRAAAQRSRRTARSQLAFVHHTVNANDYGPEDSAAIVLGIAHYHRDHNGWNDIGYNFLVDQYGQIFEGRAGGIDLAIVGAQAQGFNSVSTGVACIGTFTDVAAARRPRSTRSRA